ncbi:AroM family protein [Desulfovibrio sp. SGI.169]|uniref:AroM family protein n=1 Tax=Desulfovibrio sp. SGI.169 TaxID=3420561 RepID=UPI003D06C503
MKKRLAILSAPPISPEGLADLEPIWAGQAEVSLHSVLPDLSPASVQPYAAREGEKALMLGLNSAAPTAISIDRLVSPLEKLLARLEGRADFAFFSCAGDFPPLQTPLPLIQPNLVFRSMVKTLLHPRMKLGVVTPGAPQVGHVRASWLPYAAEAGLAATQLEVDWAPPSPEAAARCARRLAAKNIDLLAVECLGFREPLRGLMAAELGKPVILVRTVAAQLLRELVGSAEAR